jgi:hypothetical protein
MCRKSLWSRLEEGLPVVAHNVAWPDDEFRGKVASVDTPSIREPHREGACAQIPNAKQLLRPGMFLTVALLRQDVTALMVPEQAIVRSRAPVRLRGERTAGRGESARCRPAVAAGQVEILEGLAEGEFVISEGTQKAQPDKVQILRQHEAAQ